LANTGGALIGGLLGRSWAEWVVPSPAVARRLATGAIVGWLFVQLFTAWALQPSAPNGLYFGQWQPQLLGMAIFEGTVREAYLNRIPLPRGPTLAFQAIEFQQEATDTLSRLAAHLISGPPTRRIAPIIAVAHHERYHVVSLGQVGRHIVHYRRYRATDVRLRSPAIRLLDGLPELPGDSIRIIGQRRNNTVSISAEQGTTTKTFALTLSPSMGWALLNPLDHPLGAYANIGNALWIACWLALAGWWSRLGLNRADARMSVFIATAVTGLGLIPVATGFGIAAWPEWLGAVVGWIAGVLAAGYVRRHLGVPGEEGMPVVPDPI